MTSNPALNALVVQWMWNLGAVMAALALLAGLLLVVAPGWTLGFARKLNREYSFGWLARTLDAPRASEPFIYRHHRVAGIVLALASAYLLRQLYAVVTPEAAAMLWGGPLPEALALAVMQGLYYLFVLGGIAGLVAGLVIFARPSALKPVERWANRWLSTDEAAEALNRRDDRPEGLARRHPRTLGMAILVATLYIILMAVLLTV